MDGRYTVYIQTDRGHVGLVGLFLRFFSLRSVYEISECTVIV